LPPRRPCAITGWRPLFEEACRPCSARRRKASCRELRPDTVQGTRSARPRPKTRRRRRSSTDHRLDHRSGVRARLTLSSCSKASPPSRCSRAESLANSLLTRDNEQLRRPEGPPRRRNPVRRADARRSPRGDPPTPELSRSSEMQTPGRVCRSRKNATDVAANSARIGAGPVAIGHAQTRTDPSTGIRVRRRRISADGRTQSAGSSCRSISGSARDVVCGESDARSKRPLGTHRLLERTLAAFHGVVCPTTHKEAGSDLHRVCLARLCSAYRLSQPLDALLRPQPLRPCFMPVAPMGFRFQRLSPPGSGLRLSPKSSLHAVVDDWVRRLPGRLLSQPRLRGFAHPGDPYRQAGITRFLPADPLIAFASSGYTPTRPWPRASTKPPLMGFYIAPNGCPSIAMITLQSIKEPRGRRVSFEAHQPP